MKRKIKIQTIKKKKKTNKQQQNKQQQHITVSEYIAGADAIRQLL